MRPITPNTSIAPLRFLDFAMSMQQRSLERLATGVRINRAADDPAGLIASENLRAQLAQLDAESRALERADHIASTADGAMGVVSDLLVDAEGLAVAAANTAGMSDAEREAYQMEMDATVQAAQRIASTTTFNGTRLLDGSFTMSVGEASVTIGSVDPSDLGAVTDQSGYTFTLADTASGRPINLLDANVAFSQESIRAARSQVAQSRGSLGAFARNTIQPAWNANRVAFENTAAANSAIRDTDFAAETSALVRAGILASASMGAIGADRDRAASVLTLLG
jgi:flagellin